MAGTITCSSSSRISFVMGNPYQWACRQPPWLPPSRAHCACVVLAKESCWLTCAEQVILSTQLFRVYSQSTPNFWWALMWDNNSHTLDPIQCVYLHFFPQIREINLVKTHVCSTLDSHSSTSTLPWLFQLRALWFFPWARRRVFRTEVTTRLDSEIIYSFPGCLSNRKASVAEWSN